jgi:hypothetical protein
MKKIINLLLITIITINVMGQNNEIGIYFNNSVRSNPFKNNMLNFNTIGIDYYRKIANKFSIGIGGQYQKHKNSWSIGEYQGTNGVTFNFTDIFNTLNIDLVGKYLFLNQEKKFNILGQLGFTNQIYYTENVPLLIFKDLKITEQTIDKKTSIRNFAYLGTGLKYSIIKELYIGIDLFGKVLLNPKKEIIYTSQNISTTASSYGGGIGSYYTGNQYGFNLKIGYKF